MDSDVEVEVDEEAVFVESVTETTTTTITPPDTCHSLSYAYQTYLRHDEQEQNHWEDVCRSYRQYATFAMQQWMNHQYRLHGLSEDQRQLLPAGLRQETSEFQSRAAAYKDAAIRNQFCLDCILRHAGQPHSQQAVSRTYSTDSQMSKISSVLKSLARDWSADGKEERDMAYTPIMDAVRKYLPCGTSLDPPRVCVPGAGVGRLACELSAAGYSVQGNEFSLYMLLASDFVLNGPLHPSTPLAISPYLLESRNVHAVTDPMRVVNIPDIEPFTMIMSSRQRLRQGNRDEQKQQKQIKEEQAESITYDSLDDDEMSNLNNDISHDDDGSDECAVDNTPPDFSMAAGEFISIYGTEREQGRWDAVVACFFFDASPSIVEYFQVVYRMLKPGGYVFHFGPLLWHWSGHALWPNDRLSEKLPILGHQQVLIAHLDLSLNNVLEV